MHPAQEKWDRIYNAKPNQLPQAAEVLNQNLHLLPFSGNALDLACGLGGNSVLLANEGLDVVSWDISRVAIERVQQKAEELNLPIKAEVKDITASLMPQEQFDVIVVSHFLAREMSEAIEAALNPQGILFYQTFCRQKVTNIGPSNPQYLLEENELLKLFPSLSVRVYREELLAGRVGKGWRNQAMLVAQKPVS